MGNKTVGKKFLAVLRASVPPAVAGAALLFVLGRLDRARTALDDISRKQADIRARLEAPLVVPERWPV